MYIFMREMWVGIALRSLGQLRPWSALCRRLQTGSGRPRFETESRLSDGVIKCQSLDINNHIWLIICKNPITHTLMKSQISGYGPFHDVNFKFYKHLLLVLEQMSHLTVHVCSQAKFNSLFEKHNKWGLKSRVILLPYTWKPIYTSQIFRILYLVWYFTPDSKIASLIFLPTLSEYLLITGEYDNLFPDFSVLLYP